MTSEHQSLKSRDLEELSTIAPTAEAFAHGIIRSVLSAAAQQSKGKDQDSLTVELSCTIASGECGAPFHFDQKGPHGCLKIVCWPKGSEKPVAYCQCYGAEFLS